MYINYNSSKLSKVLQDFYNSTGINIQILRDDFTSLGTTPTVHNHFCKTIQSCESGILACHKSDTALLEKCKKSKKAEMHTCHAGLIDVAVPIIYDDIILGYIILGQLKEHQYFPEIEKNLSSHNLSPSEMKKYYMELPLFDFDRIQSVSNVAVMLTKYILLENMLKPTQNTNLEKAIKFVDVNLTKPLSIQYICQNVNMSKSSLYKLFHDFFNCTLSEYINKKRIEKSLEYLINSDMSIEDISQIVGFSSAAYFTLNFKKYKDTSPLKYRKSKN